MHIRQVSVLLAVAFLSASLPVFADPITIISAPRRVIVQDRVGDRASTGELQENGDVLSNTIGIVNPDGAATASGSLLSVVNMPPGFFSGLGTTATSQSSTTAGAGARADASYGVTFELSEAQQFAFAAIFAAEGTDSANRSNWAAQLNPRGSAVSIFSFTGGDSQSVLTTGLLQAGLYSFFVFGQSESFFGTGVGATSSSFDFRLTLADPGVSPTPEPASMLLLGTGVAMIARRQFKRRV